MKRKRRYYKFKFYEIVKVFPNDEEEQNLKGQEAAIIGRAMAADGIFYSLYFINNDDGIDLEESELESTGRFAPKDFHRSGESIKVVVTKDGEGMLKEEYERLKKEGNIKE